MASMKKPPVDQIRIAELRRLGANRLARVLQLAEDGPAALRDLDQLLLLARAEGRDEGAEGRLGAPGLPAEQPFDRLSRSSEA